MMLYKSKNKKVCSSDGDPDFFDIVTEVWQGYTFAPYLLILCFDYVLRTTIDLRKENGFKFKKNAKSRRYHAENMTDADYVDDLEFLANTPAQAKPLLHSLEKAAGRISLYMNANKTESMCFKQRGAISTQSGTSFKLVDQFVYPGSFFWKRDAFDSLSIKWKSNLSDKMKQDFFHFVAVSILL